MNSLFETLINQQLINQDQLRILQIEQQITNETPAQTVVRLGFVDSKLVHQLIGQAQGYKSLSLQNLEIDPASLELISESFARRHKVLPVKLDDKLLQVASTQPENLLLMDRIKQQLKDQTIQIEPILVSEQDLEYGLERCFGYQLPIERLLDELAAGKAENSKTEALNAELESSQPMVKLVDSILLDAIKAGASDLHFEPEDYYIRVRYRIDGVLQTRRLLHKNLLAGLIVRIKVLASLDLTDQRLPQDGRLSMEFFGSKVDFRVATMPTITGETVILRILDRSQTLVSLADLTSNPQVLEDLNKIIAKPHGIVLVTGPTGSGKTTTLYSLLNELNQPGVKISTLEDPVEYPMAWLQQTAIHQEIGMGFSQGIRAMLRQDPDILLIGEIRDAETAEMAFRAAMTGHQVFATLHTNSAIGALARLQDLGVSAGVLADNINGIIAQRLVRKLCANCKQPTITRPGYQEYQPQGCDCCGFIGYAGRVAVQEVLRFDQEMQQSLLETAAAAKILEQAQAKGFNSLAQNALQLIKTGVTSMQEVSRVIDMTELN